MSGQHWMDAGTWVLVLTSGFAAHWFGRFASAQPVNPDDPRSVRRARLGVALSISGPLVVLLLGTIAAAISGAWAAIGLATIAIIIAISIVGYILAPR